MDMNFDGLHHFHPFGGTSSYSVSPLDRNLPEGFINLLTFNTNGKPEIIAYNNRYTYIPKDKSNTLEAKSVLVKATPKDIMKYLAKIRIKAAFSLFNNPGFFFPIISSSQ